MMPRELPPCPSCQAKVTLVEGRRHGAPLVHFAQPCGHPVTVTIWPDRVDLEVPDAT